MGWWLDWVISVVFSNTVILHFCNPPALRNDRISAALFLFGIAEFSAFVLTLGPAPTAVPSRQRDAAERGAALFPALPL